MKFGKKTDLFRTCKWRLQLRFLTYFLLRVSDIEEMGYCILKVLSNRCLWVSLLGWIRPKVYFLYIVSKPDLPIFLVYSIVGRVKLFTLLMYSCRHGGGVLKCPTLRECDVVSLSEGRLQMRDLSISFLSHGRLSWCFLVLQYKQGWLYEGFLLKNFKSRFSMCPFLYNTITISPRKVFSSLLRCFIS